MYILRIIADDGNTRTFDDATVSVPLTFDQWRQQRFAGQAGNDAIAGAQADPDGDGSNNLLEFAMNSDPFAPGAAGALVDLETIGSEQFLRLTVSKNPLATGISFAVEVSGDLSNPPAWTTSGTTVEVDSQTTLRVRDDSPVSSASQRNIRLKVIQP
jgi:hypothetical protein